MAGAGDLLRKQADPKHMKGWIKAAGTPKITDDLRRTEKDWETLYPEPELPDSGEDEPVMPIPDDQEAGLSRRRNMARRRRASGRSSTILSADNERLGG